MERFGRSFLIFVLLGLAWWLGPKLFGSHASERQPIGPGHTETAIYDVKPGVPEACWLDTPKFKAKLSARGATLVELHLTNDPRYTTHDHQPLEVMSVPVDPSLPPDDPRNVAAASRFSLRTDFRSLGTTGPDAQVGKDLVDWTLAEHDATSCTFTWSDDQVALTKKIHVVTERPFELDVSTTVENRADAPRVHRFAIENDAWRTHEETKGGLGRQSPLMTEVACGTGVGKLERRAESDFAPDKLGKEGFEQGWLIVPPPVAFAATASAYFAQALVPIAGPGEPSCALQIEESWDPAIQDKDKDPNAGAFYKSRLVWPLQRLDPHAKATYEALAYVGPKDRNVLAAAAGGTHHLNELINLGYAAFAPISKILVKFLVGVHGLIGNWGLSIVLLTVLVRLLLLPLTWKQIQSTVAMRRLKPEVDAVNAKYADDPQQKQVAMMEVYRKNKVNPFSGCLPMLVQMPVWWALYSTLQTAVELYHTPFLYFPDLSAPDPYFVLPLVIGGFSHLQTRLMPTQVDPMQQKMMLWFMPAMFTVMMLFLPSGLGIYILTNSVLGILQQQVVERIHPSGPTGGITVKEGPSGGPGGSGGDKLAKVKG